MNTEASEETSNLTITEIKSVVDNYFYVGLAVFMIGIALVGFWRTYFRSLFSGTLEAHWIIHVHVVVFGAWLILFLSQAIIVSRNKISVHKMAGSRIGIPLGILILIVGFIVTFAVITPGVGENHEAQNYALPLLASLGDLLAFAILLTVAILYRKQPEIHKRFMVLATASLIEAPTARIAREIGMPEGFIFLVLLSLSPVFIAMCYDRWIRGSIHKVYWIGLGFLLIKLTRFMWAGESDWWLNLSAWLIEHFYPIIEPII